MPFVTLAPLALVVLTLWSTTDTIAVNRIAPLLGMLFVYALNHVERENICKFFYIIQVEVDLL